MGMSKIDKAVSNTDFANRVGVHYTFASRLRNGQRVPSMATVTAIREAFELNSKQTTDMMDAIAAGPADFGYWVNDNLFVKG